MRICYVNPTNNIRRPIAQLSNILASQGHQIAVIYPTSSHCPTKNWIANDAIHKANIKAIPIKSWYFAPLRYSFPNLIDLFKATKKAYKNNDRIHIWEYFYPLSVVPLLYSFVTNQHHKTILTTDGFVGYSYKPKEPAWLVPAFKLYTNLFARWLFKIPKKLSTYGRPMIPHAKKAGVPLRRLSIISTGIHIKEFSQTKKQDLEKLRKEFNITNEKIILFVGMLTDRKGVKKVIKISQHLLNEDHNIKTLIVGDSHGKNIYPKMVHPKYTDKIIFTGGRKDIASFMKISHVLLLPSEGEGLPGVVMEAMTCKLPVVATKEGCTPDLISQGKEGYLITRGDTKGYLHAVRKILTTQNTMGRAGHRKIQNFSWKKVVNKYLNLYSS